MKKLFEKNQTGTYDDDERFIDEKLRKKEEMSINKGKDARIVSVQRQARE